MMIAAMAMTKTDMILNKHAVKRDTDDDIINHAGIMLTTEALPTAANIRNVQTHDSLNQLAAKLQ